MVSVKKRNASEVREYLMNRKLINENQRICVKELREALKEIKAKRKPDIVGSYSTKKKGDLLELLTKIIKDGNAICDE